MRSYETVRPCSSSSFASVPSLTAVRNRLLETDGASMAKYTTNDWCQLHNTYVLLHKTSENQDHGNFTGERAANVTKKL